MAIITISRQLGSLGDEIAKKLSEEVHFNYFDKDLLEEDLVKECQMSEKNVERYDEKKPRFWETFSADRERYFHYLKTRLYKFAHQGDCVFTGMGGYMLFQDIPGTLRVKIVAPEKLRIERVKTALNYDDRLAEQVVRHSDRDRAGFHKGFFHVNWEDTNFYDLILNTGIFTVEAAIRQLKDAIDSTGILAEKPEKDEKLAERCLQYEVISTIVCKERIPVKFLEVVVTSGAVILRGATIRKEHIKRCETIAREVSGVERVINEIRYIHNPYSMRS